MNPRLDGSPNLDPAVQATPSAEAGRSTDNSPRGNRQWRSSLPSGSNS